MKIPVFANVKYTEENGYLTSAMQMYNDELNRVLQNGLSDNGWTLPTVTQQQLTDIMNLPVDQQMPDGTIWYVSQDAPLPPYHEVVVKINGVLRKITTAAYP